MRLMFVGEDENIGLKKGNIYEVIISSKYGDPKIYAQFKAEDTMGDWQKCPYSSLKIFNKNWSDSGV